MLVIYLCLQLIVGLRICIGLVMAAALITYSRGGFNKMLAGVNPACTVPSCCFGAV